MTNQKGFVWLPILLGILGLVILGGGVSAYMLAKNPQPQASIYQPATTTPTQEDTQTTTLTQVKFTASSSSGAAPLYLYFDTPGDSKYTSYYVDFGDGTKDNMYQSEIDCADKWCNLHTYEKPGTYIAKLYGNGKVQDNLKMEDTYGTISGSPILIGTLKITVTGLQSITVPGMSKYTDADFGFSFWYPSGWKVSSFNSFRNDTISDATEQKMFQISGNDAYGNPVLIEIGEFYSVGASISEPDGGAPMGHPHPAVTYFFDASTHTWMVRYPNGLISERDGSLIEPVGYTTSADVSQNTMGGLHMLSGNGDTIIPLSAHSFLVFDTPIGDKLLNTVIATDQSVATPVSAAEQIKTIQSEKDAYAN